MHHPDIRFLTDYAAGSLPRSQAICVAVHNYYCRDCCRQVEAMQALGGALLDCLEPTPCGAGDFDALMARIDALATAPEAEVVEATDTGMPPPLRKISRGNLDALNWRSVGSHLRYHPLDLDEPGRETALIRIRAGGRVPHHSHRGDEIMVVLEGGFSDNRGSYRQGDFIHRTDGDPHSPAAATDEDCLCLSTLDAPLRVSNPFYRWLLFMARR